MLATYSSPSSTGSGDSSVSAFADSSTTTSLSLFSSSPSLHRTGALLFLLPPCRAAGATFRLPVGFDRVGLAAGCIASLFSMDPTQREPNETVGAAPEDPHAIPALCLNAAMAAVQSYDELYVKEPCTLAPTPGAPKIFRGLIGSGSNADTSHVNGGSCNVATWNEVWSGKHHGGTNSLFTHHELHSKLVINDVRRRD